MSLTCKGSIRVLCARMSDREEKIPLLFGTPSFRTQKVDFLGCFI